MAGNNNGIKASSYILRIKDWKIQEVISGYLNALLIYKNSNKSDQIPTNISFSNLRKMCDILYDAKENFHLIFKRVLNPKKQIFEQSNKLMPSKNEIEFINVIGLLFHRVMIARELKYLLDSYEIDSDGFHDIDSSYITNINKIKLLFEHGLDLLIKLLDDYSGNIKLLSYFIDNKNELMPIFDYKFDKILKILSAGEKIDTAYFGVIEYYMESGWKNKASFVLKEFLKLQPRNKQAVGILKKMKKLPTLSY